LSETNGFDSAAFMAGAVSPPLPGAPPPQPGDLSETGGFDSTTFMAGAAPPPRLGAPPPRPGDLSETDGFASTAFMAGAVSLPPSPGPTPAGQITAAPEPGATSLALVMAGYLGMQQPGPDGGQRPPFALAGPRGTPRLTPGSHSSTVMAGPVPAIHLPSPAPTLVETARSRPTPAWPGLLPGPHDHLPTVMAGPVPAIHPPSPAPAPIRKTRPLPARPAISWLGPASRPTAQPSLAGLATPTQSAATPAAPRRSLALHLPWLAAERRRIAGPWASWEAERQQRRIVAVSAAAAAAGISPGQTLADAQAILPDLSVEPAEPLADLAWLRRLALWANTVTPLAAPNPPDGLLLDITGVPHLHGGEQALLNKLVQHLARLGLTVQAAIAGAPPAAAALARTAPGCIVPPGEEAAALTPLPLSALRLPHGTAAALHRLGLRRVGDVLRQPRGPLARRFGAALTLALDAATGQHPTPIQPLRPPAAFLASREFLEPLITREALDAVLEVLLGQLCRQLAEAGKGARRLLLLGFRVDGTLQALHIGTGLPARDPRHFARLFQPRMEKLEPGFGFERLTLEARFVEDHAAPQNSLPSQGGPSAEARQEALAALLDRLAQRLPVWRLEPRESHIPERAVLKRDPFAPIAGAAWSGPPRPLRLLRRPLALQVTAPLPDEPPIQLRHGSRVWRVQRAEGPERIEPEWWRPGPHPPFRDYYRVELTSGARLWVCRSGAVVPGETARWWLHGRFE
jgi:protein ImuB